MNQYDQAKAQFKSVIRSSLNRWFEESDLDSQELAETALEAIDEWLDEDIVDFKPDEG